jgi:hypothetical protein
VSNNPHQPFFTTLPGIISALATLIVALTGLYVALNHNKADAEPSKATPTATAGPTTSTPATPEPTSTKPPEATHCAKPTAPVLTFPGNNQTQPNHYYGQGVPWRFRWLASNCRGGSIRGYNLVVQAEGAPSPALDEFVEGTEFTGNTSGTVGASRWTWKVRAIDDENRYSDWSEERTFVVPPYVPPLNPNQRLPGLNGQD